MKSLRFVIEIFRKYPWLCLVNAMTAAIMSFLGAMALVALTPIIDMFLNAKGGDLSPLTVKVTGMMRSVGIPISLSWEIGILIFLVLITSVAQVWGSNVIIQTKYALLKDMMLGCFDDFFRARWLFFSSNEQGKILNTIHRELSSVGDGFIAIGSLFSNFVQIAIIASVPLFISWQVTVLALICGGLVSILILVWSRSVDTIGHQCTKTSNDLSGVVYENICAAKLVLGYGNRGHCIERLSQAYDEHLRWAVKFTLFNYTVSTAYRPIGVIVVVIVLLASRYFVIPVSEMMVLLLALFQLVTLFGNVLSLKNRISFIIPGYEQIKSLRTLAKTMEQVSGKEHFNGLVSSIKLDKLTFAYPGRDPVFKNIELEIPKGKMVALVGCSGAGKSTLLDLILGLHQPTSGRVLIDGVDLVSLDISQYRAKVGYVPQESFLFNTSVRENLLWSQPQATEEEIEAACRLANAEEFILRLPQKYDTVVGDRGVRLSGGQIQRLALARAFLREPDIMIFDEATNALDSHSVRLIQQAIEEFAKSTTMIIVAHRLATIKRADIIYVLDRGQIVECGTYIDLCEQGACFAKMVEVQQLGVEV